MNDQLRELLQTMAQQGSSDLHLVEGSPAQIRVDGRLQTVNDQMLSGDDIGTMCYSILDEVERQQFDSSGELDKAILLEGTGRFRLNMYKALGQPAAAFRIIPESIPSLDDLNCPAVYKSLVKREKGLILVTGPTGSGKSTTLAAMLNEINLTEHKHIITIEDPVEFIHRNHKCLYSHRNVGKDTQSFPQALKYAMREDPDIILIGEMRDRATIEAALTAAETGHLVFGTLHTNSAPQTINRIIDVFPGDEQAQIRAQLSVSLVAVIAQVLVPKVEKGRVAVPEILLNTSAVGNLIRESKVHQIYSQMELGRNMGMQTQPRVMAELVQDGIIAKETAFQFSNNPDELMRNLSGS